MKPRTYLTTLAIAAAVALSAAGCSVGAPEKPDVSKAPQEQVDVSTDSTPEAPQLPDKPSKAAITKSLQKEGLSVLFGNSLASYLHDETTACVLNVKLTDDGVVWRATEKLYTAADIAQAFRDTCYNSDTAKPARIAEEQLKAAGFSLNLSEYPAALYVNSRDTPCAMGLVAADESGETVRPYQQSKEKVVLSVAKLAEADTFNTLCWGDWESLLP